MKNETTEHRQVVIAAMIAVVTTLMIMMLTAQKSHATHTSQSDFTPRFTAPLR